LSFGTQASWSLLCSPEAGLVAGITKYGQHEYVEHTEKYHLLTSAAKSAVDMRLGTLLLISQVALLVSAKLKIRVTRTGFCPAFHVEQYTLLAYCIH
jgi:hypothetical protein